MSRRRFLGSKDPNTIVLENLFPLTTIKLSTKLKEKEDLKNLQFQEFVFEGEEKHLRFIETNSAELETQGWRLGDPLQKGDTELRMFRQRAANLSEFIEIPVFRGWHELGNHFVLANRVDLTVRKEEVCILKMTCDILGGASKSELLRVETSRAVYFQEKERWLN